ncbi:deoxyribodipyrimidine photo-lyase [Chryseobacterium sp. Bi04]|uniref:deoxyribodipyrimidine photo-lyase n=1 Tax=Chryseobacterium sp. Bi04 TaxID=2822345 RepID=UPI001DF99367|nr:deoxyribodipyrimidine photo-lyase [Chryseobacterium sp. Bi04]CAH0290371.1 hypothetical protein SRABI04_04322 [Chryseobacterium sp. Bi04]
MDKVNIFWFRRDLRLEDDSGLHHALDRERACDRAHKSQRKSIEAYKEALAE